jgi:hypothetical protein
MTGTPSRADSGAAIARATTSLLPPAENGTTIRIVFGIGACADATPAITRRERARHELGEAIHETSFRRERRSAHRSIALLCSTRALARIICPNGHLGFAPTREESFRLGVARAPRLHRGGFRQRRRRTDPARFRHLDQPARVADARPRADARSRRAQLRVPMIIGSAGDTGANSRVDLFVD